jgi:hypothetical protein
VEWRGEGRERKTVSPRDVGQRVRSELSRDSLSLIDTPSSLSCYRLYADAFTLHVSIRHFTIAINPLFFRLPFENHSSLPRLPAYAIHVKRTLHTLSHRRLHTHSMLAATTYPFTNTMRSNLQIFLDAIRVSFPTTLTMSPSKQRAMGVLLIEAGSRTAISYSKWCSLCKSSILH